MRSLFLWVPQYIHTNCRKLDHVWLVVQVLRLPSNGGGGPKLHFQSYREITSWTFWNLSEVRLNFWNLSEIFSKVPRPFKDTFNCFQNYYIWLADIHGKVIHLVQRAPPTTLTSSSTSGTTTTSTPSPGRQQVTLVSPFFRSCIACLLWPLFNCGQSVLVFMKVEGWG